MTSTKRCSQNNSKERNLNLQNTLTIGEDLLVISMTMERNLRFLKTLYNWECC